jgi:hypothetical protein
MNDLNGNNDARLLENLSQLDGAGEPPPLDPGLESRLLDRLARRRRRLLPHPWDLVLLVLLLAILAWDVVRIVRILMK